jgi:hypothetical protein
MKEKGATPGPSRPRAGAMTRAYQAEGDGWDFAERLAAVRLLREVLAPASTMLVEVVLVQDQETLLGRGSGGKWGQP